MEMFQRTSVTLLPRDFKLGALIWVCFESFIVLRTAVFCFQSLPKRCVCLPPAHKHGEEKRWSAVSHCFGGLLVGCCCEAFPQPKTLQRPRMLTQLPSESHNTNAQSQHQPTTSTSHNQPINMSTMGDRIKEGLETAKEKVGNGMVGWLVHKAGEE